MSDNEMLVPQPRLGKKGMIMLITMCNLMAPLSTDMYMPALPEMKEYFHTSDGTMNLSLSAFFFVFAVGMLFFGSVSDRNGRKTMLILGILMYITGCVGCSVSMSILFLILMRMIQALGAGCMVSVSTAIVRDQFTGPAQASVLSVAQIFSVVGPVLSPVIGAFVYQTTGWRMVFIAQGTVTLLILVTAVLMKETLPKEDRLAVGILQTLSRQRLILKNRRFSFFLFGIIFLNAPCMAYIGTSSYIYQNYFGLSVNWYTAIFAATALLSSLGPVMYALIRPTRPFLFSNILFGITVATGLVMLLTGRSNPFVFAALVCIQMIVTVASRPFATARLLNMQEKDAGAASSLINFFFTMMGTLGMYLITGIWSDYILGIAIMMMTAGVAGGLILNRAAR
ncbi:MAG: MFS transporter [Firmicutes bacterium]|nr:MFS transporter [Bacillota bacterium]